MTNLKKVVLKFVLHTFDDIFKFEDLIFIIF